MKKRYEKILVAIDGSKASDQAFEQAIELAKDHKAQLILSHVIDSRIFTTAGSYDSHLAEEMTNRAKELLDTYVKKAKLKGFDRLIQNIEYGSPKVKIARDVAKHYDVDLIVCGAKGLNAVERFLIGSVSEAIVRNATCDVLVVR